ncbi:MAG: PAS domain S-box protein [Euryarchaeota archaeon]|nr:PAS domain S-box protein [Euryarchaeota archaeon]
MAVILVDTYLHVKATKRNLIYSYLPTSLMISGVGLTIMFAEASISYIFHYIVFCCLLLVVIIDQKRILTLTDTKQVLPGKKPFNLWDEKESTTRASHLPDQEPIQRYAAPSLTTDSVALNELIDSSEMMAQRIQVLNGFLERKMIKLEKAEQEIEEQRKNLIEQQEMFIDRLIHYYNRKDNIQVVKPTEPILIEPMIVEEKIENHLVIGGTTECIVVVQRGIVKQASGSFAEILGYAKDDIINKSLLGFFTDQGKEEAKKYWLGNLKGAGSNSYKTVFLTKEYKEIPVEITVKPTIYNGMFAEFLIVKSSNTTET